MSALCIIAGAMEPGKMIPPEENDLLIAADGGLVHLSRRRLVPHLIVGDFDSLGRVPEGDNIIRHPVEKDDTDTMLAIKTGLDRGYRTFLLYGCLGGRLDHTYANLQALLYLARHGATGFLLGQGMAASVIQNGQLHFSSAQRGTVSVFCPAGEARGVTLAGLRYPLRDAVLTSGFPLGVSNQFTGQPASVSVRDGELLVMWDHADGTLPEQAES